MKLTMMGGVRDEADQARLDALKVLAAELGVAVSLAPEISGFKSTTRRSSESRTIADVIRTM